MVFRLVGHGAGPDVRRVPDALFLARSHRNRAGHCARFAGGAEPSLLAGRAVYRVERRRLRAPRFERAGRFRRIGSGSSGRARTIVWLARQPVFRVERAARGCYGRGAGRTRRRQTRACDWRAVADRRADCARPRAVVCALDWRGQRRRATRNYRAPHRSHAPRLGICQRQRRTSRGQRNLRRHDFARARPARAGRFVAARQRQERARQTIEFDAAPRRAIAHRARRRRFKFARHRHAPRFHRRRARARIRGAARRGGRS